MFIKTSALAIARSLAFQNDNNTLLGEMILKV